MRARCLFFAVTALAIFAAPAAQAASIFDQDLFGFPLSPGSQPGHLSQFDPSLGTLTAVELMIDATVQAQVTAENDSIIAGSMGVSLTGVASATGSGLSANGIILQVAGSVPVAATGAYAPTRFDQDEAGAADEPLLVVFDGVARFTRRNGGGPSPPCQLRTPEQHGCPHARDRGSREGSRLRSSHWRDTRGRRPR